MKPFLFSLSAILLSSALAFADAVPGQPAPDFTGTDASGKVHKLSDSAGKWTVLEWSNKECPYVRKHYDSGNMQKLQKNYTQKGVVWYTVLSSAKGKEGYTEPADALKQVTADKASPTAVLMDPTGTIGRAYGAKTTPHMFVINPQGKVVYAGAIDNNDSSDPAVIAKSKNYVSAALDAGLSGKPVEVAVSRAYGCGVKYQ